MYNFWKSSKYGEKDAVTSYSSTWRDPVSSPHPAEAELLEIVALLPNPMASSQSLSFVNSSIGHRWQPAHFLNIQFLGHYFSSAAPFTHCPAGFSLPPTP